MIKQQTKALLHTIATLFFSCALVMTCIPASAVAVQEDTTQEKALAEQSATEDAAVTNQASPEKETTASNVAVAAAPGESPVTGTFDKNTETGAEQGMYVFYKESGTLIIKPNKNIKAQSCTITGIPWRDDTNFTKAEVKSVIFEGKVFMDDDITKTFDGFTNVTTIDLTNLDTSKMTKMNAMFKGCSSLANIIGIDKINTSSVTTMYEMFKGCAFLNKLDLSGFDTSSVQNMSSMFEDCIALRELNVSSFNTSNVTNMGLMFYNCKDLLQLDVSSFDTTKVAGMNGMFRNCQKLENINLINFNTANATNMYEMFYECHALKSLNLSSFNTSNVQNMSSMFRMCIKLESLTLSTGFKGTKTKDINNMFSGCTALKSVDLKDFDTPNVGSTNEMFQSCKNLESIDLSRMSTKRTSNMKNMFQGCEKLKKLTVSDEFSFKGAVIKDVDIGLDYAYLPDETAKWVSSLDGSPCTPTQITEETHDKAALARTYYKTPVDISFATIEPITTTQTYTGKPVNPHPTVTLGPWSLVEGAAYECKYLSNIVAGKAWLYIEGKGDFTGKSKTVEFTISPKSITSATVTISPQPYTGDARMPNPTVVIDGKTLSADADYKVTYKDNINPGTATAIITGQTNYTGTISKEFTISKSVPIPVEEKITMYRLYNKNSGEHLFTSDANEVKTLVPLGWKNEGTAWIAPKESSTPVYRLYNPYSGDHHYTKDLNEYNTLGKIGWRQENIAWYSDSLQGVPVYRLFNPNATIGTHHYTTDKNEYDTLGKKGWRKEEICWYGMK